MTVEQAIRHWCDFVTGQGTVFVGPTDYSPPVHGLREPKTKEELDLILSQDGEKDWIEDMLVGIDPAILGAVRAVDGLLERFPTSDPEEHVRAPLLRRYLLHRFHHGLPPEEFRALDFPPDAMMPRTIREMGWPIDEFLEASLERFSDRLAKILEKLDAM